MAEVESTEFTTSILTSKAPQQSASLVNEGVQQTQELIGKRLIGFFENHINLLQKQNYDLKGLLSKEGNAVSSYLGANNEFGLIANIWNNYNQLLGQQIAANDHQIKFLKLEILSPLINLINNDIKFSELLINNQELIELASESPINEYKWNDKAVPIINNFQTFKANEKKLILNQLISLLNQQNGTLGKLQQMNEGSLNFALKNFNINNEMNNYLHVLLNKEYPALPKLNYQQQFNGNKSSAGASQLPTPPPSSSKRHSKVFGSSSSSNEKDKSKKEKTKLKSRVGSIFGGRRRKSKKSTDLESIYSNQTASTNVTGLTNLREEPPISSVRSKPISANASSAAPVPVPAPASQSQPEDSTYSYLKETPSVPRAVSNSSINQNPNRDLPILPVVQTPVISETPAHAHQVSRFDPKQSEPVPVPSAEPVPQVTTEPVEPVAAPATQTTLEDSRSPNIIKYSDDSSDDETNIATAERSVQPPFEDPHSYLNVNKSRHTQYSFELGDDLKNFTTSPKIQKNAFEQQGQQPGYNEVDGLDDDSSDEEPETVGELPFKRAPAQSAKYGVVSDNGSINGASPSSSASAPPPPPARKVVHHDDANPTRRSEVHSQIFHSLPNARDSVIERPHFNQPLVSQATGTSLSSTATGRTGHDLFNHNDLLNNLIAGLNVSNSQVINLNFKSDNLTKASIIGEIAFNYQGNSQAAIDLTIPNNYDKTILNNVFVEKLDANLFRINPTTVFNKTLGGIKYMQSNLPISLIPIFIHSVWKYEDHQASLLVNLKLNPNFAESVIVDNLVVSVALKSDVEAYSASSKPTGTFNKEKNRITWRFNGPTQLNSNDDQKLIARFKTNGKGTEDESGIQLRFSIANHLQQDITSNGEIVNSTSNLNAGSYNSNS